MRKRVATKHCVKKFRGLISQDSISDLARTSFGPCETCSQSGPSPERFWKGKALQWSAAWFAAAVVVACAAASG